MLFQSLLALHGLQKKSKGITACPGKQGAVHQELLGAQRAVLNHSLGTALPNKPNSSTATSAQSNSSTFLPQEDAGKTVPLPPPQGHCTHRFPGEESQAQQTPSTAVPFHSLPPQQCIIHVSDISTANLAKQKCFFFNTSRNWELSGENSG